ncbi:MAG: BolA family transcriptional regulator [Chromatiales bacterium]|nr:BolA family transcriptional regulator [Chromatiales bacterium]
MSASRIEQIRSRIETAFAPISLEIIDESHKHAGHASAKGGGHFIVQIVSDAFAGKSTIQRHRMVYEAMGELMQHEVHALSIQAKTPQES